MPAKSLIVILVCSSLAVFSKPGVSEIELPYAHLRSDFVKAYRAAELGLAPELAAYKLQLKNYPLYPYLIYAELDRAVETLERSQFDQFAASYADSPLVKRLRNAWLRSLIERKNWKDFLGAYEPSSSRYLQCAYLHARIVEQKTDKNFENEILQTWMSAKKLSSLCDLPSEYLKKQHGLSVDNIWERVNLAMAHKNTRLVKSLKSLLPKKEQRWVDAWLRCVKNPADCLNQARAWDDNRFSRDITRHSLEQLAWEDASESYRMMQALGKTLQWDSDSMAGMAYTLALASSTEYSADAITRIKAVPLSHQDDRLVEWAIRVSIYRSDWLSIIESIEQLSQPLQSSSQWQYWLARALKASNSHSEAFLIFKKIAKEANYYGFLAADQIGDNYQICVKPTPLNTVIQQRLLAYPPMQRALELYSINWPLNARREWHHATRKLNGNARRQAAIIADDMGWHSRAILALLGPEDQQDYRIRFPLAYQRRVNKSSKRFHLDPAWVYAIIRAESAFQADAHSPADARGLMQLLPNTGFAVSRRHRLKLNSKADFFKPSQNINAGSAYFRQLVDKYGNNALFAIAAYNAGSVPVERWIKNSPVGAESDVWAETVTYAETRRYIQQVLAFAVIYDWRFDGKTMPMKRRLQSFQNAQFENQESLLGVQRTASCSN